MPYNNNSNNNNDNNNDNNDNGTYHKVTHVL